MTAITKTADLIVVGGGLAGLTGALRAAELGLRVILLERGEGERYLCNSRLSGGIIHICFLDVRRPPRELYDAIIKATSAQVNEAQASALAHNAGRLIDWLQQHGARFMRFNMQEATRWCMAPPRALVPGPDWIDRGPDTVLRELMRRFQAGGGEVMLGTRAVRLLMRDDACRGVVAEQDGAEVECRAAAVVIADGGFQADRASFSQHIGATFDAVFQRGARTGIGDGLRMAAQAGARLTNLKPFYGHLLAAEARGNDKLWPYPELDAFATAGVIVGPHGRRLANEAAGGVAVANALAQLADAGAATAVFDAAIWDGPGRAHRIPANPLLEEAGATIHRADSIEGLAKLIDVPADALAETVALHNAAIDSKDFSRLTPPREGPVQALPIRTPPFMAIKAIPGITYTMGGIEIDGRARVISTRGVPIQGLYAAGSATGGLEGGGRNAYIGGLVKAGVFGLLAGEEAARAARPAAVDTATAPPRGPAPAPAKRFPVLDLIVRHGDTAAAILAPLTALLVAWLCWIPLGWVSLPLAALAGAIVYTLVRSYTEIVTLITEMLMPR